jgi:hypothetical protein
MMARIQSYEVEIVAVAAVFGASALIIGNEAPFAYASPSSVRDVGAAKMHT